MALAKPHGVKETWLIVSDQPTDVTTFDAYGLRFDIEENFLDDKSNGFQLESSLLRSAEALTRLCLVLAVATLFLVCQGTEVVETEKRRLVRSLACFREAIAGSGSGKGDNRSCVISS